MLFCIDFQENSYMFNSEVKEMKKYLVFWTATVATSYVMANSAEEAIDKAKSDEDEDYEESSSHEDLKPTDAIIFE